VENEKQGPAGSYRYFNIFVSGNLPVLSEEIRIEDEFLEHEVFAIRLVAMPVSSLPSDMYVISICSNEQLLHTAKMIK